MYANALTDAFTQQNCYIIYMYLLLFNLLPANFICEFDEK